MKKWYILLVLSIVAIQPICAKYGAVSNSKERTVAKQAAGTTITFPRSKTKIFIPNGKNLSITDAKVDAIENTFDFASVEAGNQWADASSRIIKNAAGPSLETWLTKKFKTCEEERCILSQWQGISPAFDLEKKGSIKYIGHRVINNSDPIFLRDFLDFISDNRVSSWVKEDFPRFNARKINSIALLGKSAKNATSVAEAIGMFLHYYPNRLTEIQLILKENERDAYIRALQRLSEDVTLDPNYFEDVGEC